MKLLVKIIGALLIIFVIGVGILILSFYLDDSYEQQFMNVPIDHNLKKPTPYLTYSEIDSLKVNHSQKNDLIVIGDGYSGYDFYFWYQPTEEGELYIKAYEITQELALSEDRLYKKTLTKVVDNTISHRFYKASSLIYEGTFDQYYPARFELWFKSKTTGSEQKIIEKSYLIDGWDR